MIEVEGLGPNMFKHVKISLKCEHFFHSKINKSFVKEQDIRCNWDKIHGHKVNESNKASREIKHNTC